MNFNTTVVLYISICNIIYALSIKRVGFLPTKSIFTPLGCYHLCWECMKWSQICSVVSNSLQPHGIYSPWDSPGQNTGVGFPFPADLPDPGIEPGAPALQVDSLSTEPSGKPLRMLWASLVAQRLKCLPPMRETRVWSLGWEDPLEKEMATCYSILAWRIPRTEELGRLQSTGSQRVRQDWVT